MKYWHTVAIRREVDEAVAWLTNHPDYDQALRRSVYGALDFHDANPTLGLLFQDIGTFGLGILALYLDATGGITHRRLAELGSTSSILSTGRASAILGLMRIKGLAYREGSGKQTRYVPSERLTYFFRERFKVELSALAIVEPEILSVLERWHEPDAALRFWAFFGAELMRGTREPVEDVESFESISEHRAGFLILFDLLRRADRGAEFPSLNSFEIVVSETARRFSVSRAHMRRMMDKFEKDGFMVREQGTGAGLLLPELHTKFRKYVALLHLGVLASSYEVMRPFE